MDAKIKGKIPMLKLGKKMSEFLQAIIYL